jgi:hypothetical protein
MDQFLELNLIGRIQSMLINLDQKGVSARSQMLWLFLGLIEAGFRIGHLTAAEYAEYERMAGEMLCYSRGAL